MRVSKLVSVSCCVAACGVVFGQVSVKSLLPEMTDMRFLTRRPSPVYTSGQASSYDRASKSPKEGWYSNADAGKYLRSEEVSGRVEHVMADLKGPGAATRIWSANPTGVIRFYFDGESEARFSAKMADLLSGKVSPLTTPFGYGAAQGFNLYFPFPYETSLKVTVDNAGGDAVKGLYYHVGYRTYAPGTQVQSFAMDDFRANADVIARTAVALERGAAMPAQGRVQLETKEPRLSPRRPLRQLVGTQGPGKEIREVIVQIPFPLVRTIRMMDFKDFHQPHNVLRNLFITIKFDGEECVNVPLGDFFGTVPGLNPYRSHPMEVMADGTMICRFPMPFKKRAEISITSRHAVEVPVTLRVVAVDREFDANSYYFRAQWLTDRGSTRPMRDLEFLKTKGEGLWVGTNMHIQNPTPAWWGEGDEKVYVDGETFPSTFGTGTEDYFGYAWCSPIPFSMPYHGQPRCDGPGNFGHTSVHRWHILDPIPFTKSLQFDIEMWHWAEVDATFTRTAYWYARPGGQKPADIDEKLLALRELAPAAPVKGALEGETLKIVEVTGGKTEKQGGFWELSAGQQLWWMDAAPGHKLVLEVPVTRTGRYEIVGNFCSARDYGIHQISVNRKPVAPIDFYGTGVTWARRSLGTFTLEKGKARIEVESQGCRKEAIPRNMFGLDYLLLVKK